MHPHKLRKQLVKLRKDPKAFAKETAHQTSERIRKDVQLAEVKREQILQVMEPAVEAGLENGLLEMVVSEMIADGELSKATGKALGRAIGKLNQVIRPALAKLNRNTGK